MFLIRKNLFSIILISLSTLLFSASTSAAIFSGLIEYVSGIFKPDICFIPQTYVSNQSQQEIKVSTSPEHITLLPQTNKYIDPEQSRCSNEYYSSISLVSAIKSRKLICHITATIDSKSIRKHRLKITNSNDKNCTATILYDYPSLNHETLSIVVH